jgi:hypothetical protein
MDPPVVRCLRFLQRGMAKPIQSPRQQTDLFTAFPELPVFRPMSRVLTMQQYVLLADGRVPEALANLQLCLRFGRAVELDGIIGGLVGVAIQATGISALGSHLEQLGARDCETLFRLATGEIKQPDPLPRLLEAERRFARTTLAQARTADRATLEKMGRELFGMKEVGDDPERTRALAEMRALLDSPARLADVVGQAERRLDAYFDRAQEEVKKPAWERTWDLPKPDGSYAARIEQLLSPSVTKPSEAFTTAAARLQLLAVHAAVLRYRWEREQVPPNLAALELGDLVIDPCTGAPLKYEPQGRRRYRLTSAGRPADANDPNAVEGRRPLSIVPGD